MATINITANSATDVNALINSTGGGSGSSNRGWFEGSMLTTHDSFGFQSSTSSSAFVAEGALTYNPIPLTPNAHILQGSVDSIDIGTGLNHGTGSGYSATAPALATTQLQISGLGIGPNSGAGNQTHTIVFGLVNGDESALNNYIFNTAANSINFTGSAGNDSITGGLGADTFAGNGGADTFAFASGAHANGDRVTDFNGDVLDLSAFFLAGFGSGPATGEAWSYVSGSDTIVTGDSDFDGLDDFVITLSNFTGSLNAGTEVLI